MTDDEILQMGLRSGYVEEVKCGIDVYRFDIVGLRNFIALVLANNPPPSSMSWRDGYEAGKQAEQARLQAFMRQMIDAYALQSTSVGLQKKPNQE